MRVWVGMCGCVGGWVCVCVCGWVGVCVCLCVGVCARKLNCQAAGRKLVRGDGAERGGCAQT